ncbi:MAG: hypothetical protein WKF47_19220 [Geodermatophilaceae bacterium]
MTTWYGALQQARALPDSDLPPLTLPSSGPPPPNRWAEREPAAAARLVAARKVIAELIAAHDVPAENLLNPDLLRRLAWHPPTPLTDDTVAERLRDGGAREWQIGLTAGLGHRHDRSRELGGSRPRPRFRRVKASFTRTYLSEGVLHWTAAGPYRCIDVGVDTLLPASNEQLPSPHAPQPP